MSRFLEKNNEGKTFSNIGPIRWMAPESLAQNIYSKKSDVWTFGIVVWEIVVQSEPHANVPALDVGILIRDYNLTPPIPKNCIPLLRQLMEMCWRRNPEQRPSFEVIWELLK
jgi:serine/threonine protein kinase